MTESKEISSTNKRVLGCIEYGWLDSKGLHVVNWTHEFFKSREGMENALLRGPDASEARANVLVGDEAEAKLKDLLRCAKAEVAFLNEVKDWIHGPDCSEE